MKYSYNKMYMINVIISSILFVVNSHDNSGNCTVDYQLANGTQVFIASPKYPHKYPNNLNCTWNFLATNKNTNLLFLYILDFETDFDGDFVSAESDGKMLFNCSGEATCFRRKWDYLIGSFISFDNTLKVRFTSDSISTPNEKNGGFNITVYSSNIFGPGTPPPPCVCNDQEYQVTSPINISFPTAPGVYGAHCNCSSTLTAPSGAHLRLRFPAFATERSADFLSVWEGDVRRAACSGHGCPTLTSATNTLRLAFSSDGFVSLQGYVVEVSVVADYCDCGMVNLDGSHATTTDLGLVAPSSWTGTCECEWLVSLPAFSPWPRLYLTFGFDRASSETTCGTSLFFGASATAPGAVGPVSVIADMILRNRIGYQNHIDNPKYVFSRTAIVGETSVTSPGKDMVVSFACSAGHSFDGRLRVAAKGSFEDPSPNCLCGDRLVPLLNENSTFNLFSPNYPEPFGPNCNCLWTFQAPNGFLNLNLCACPKPSIMLRRGVSTGTLFLSSMVHETTRVLVFDGRDTSASLLRDCSKDPTFHAPLCMPLVGSGEYLTVQFLSGYTIPPNVPWSSPTDTFILNIASAPRSCDCGATLIEGLSDAHTIRTPNYPAAYPAGCTCEWIIQNRNFVVGAVFDKFHLADGDNLSISDQFSSSFPALSACTGSTCPNVTVNTNHLSLLFTSKPDSPGATGFSANILEPPCDCGDRSRSVVSLAGGSVSFTSPNWPKPYPFNCVCDWTIDAGEGSTVKLKIDGLDFSYNKDGLYFFNSANDTRNISSADAYCAGSVIYQTCDEYTSTGRYLSIRFVGDQDRNGLDTGFSLRVSKCCGFYFPDWAIGLTGTVVFGILMAAGFAVFTYVVRNQKKATPGVVYDGSMANISK